MKSITVWMYEKDQSQFAMHGASKPVYQVASELVKPCWKGWEEQSLSPRD